MVNLKELLHMYQVRVNTALDQFLPPEDLKPEVVHKAMRYSLFSGGKRIRPALVYMAGTALGAPLEVLDAPATAVECIHTYSLVHDDLPAMDNDDLRRGRPTCHVAFGQANALLAGDGLLTQAFEILAGHSQAELAGPLALALARGAGTFGMIGGQVADMEAEGQGLEDVATLEGIHERKTGALIRASLKMGGLAAGASDEDLGRLEAYGRAIGLAFQVADDILDVTSDAKTLGKTPGKDEIAGKMTYPALLGLEGARSKGQALIKEATEALAPWGEKAEPLARMASYIIERTH